VDSFKRGVVGTMPGADLIRGLVPLWDALQAGDTEKADQIHGPLAALVSMQTSLDAFLAVEKHLLVRQGIFKNTLVRGPVGYRLDDETRREVDRLFDRMIAAAEAATSPSRQANWQVCRTDDNGNDFVMCDVATEVEARRLVEEFTQRGHKQHYWLRRA
jgi:hypothetical protein